MYSVDLSDVTRFHHLMSQYESGFSPPFLSPGQLPVLLRANQLLHLRPQAGQADGLLLHALPSPHLLRLPGQLFSVPQPAGVQK